MKKYKRVFMRNEFIRNLVLGPMKNIKFFWLQKELFPLPFLEFWSFFSFFLQFLKYRNQILYKTFFRDCYNFDPPHVTFEYYIIFNILKCSSNKKLEKGKLNKKSSLFRIFLELHLLLGLLWEKRVRKITVSNLNYWL